MPTAASSAPRRARIPHRHRPLTSLTPGSASDPTRVALITGGTGSLGDAVLHTFLDRGCPIAVTYRNPADADRLHAQAGDRPLLPIQADATSTTAMEDVVAQTVARFGRLDHLINLVGGWAGGTSVAETTAEAWDHMIALNLRSAFAACRAVVPHMLAQRYGRIVNVSSRAALHPSPGAAAYAVAKAGVISLTQTLALELYRYPGDLTANCVLPSVIDTPANRRDMPRADPSHWVDPAKLAAIIAWLTSDDASPISGAAIPIYARA